MTTRQAAWLAACWALAGCQMPEPAPPQAARIESVAMRAVQSGDAEAEQLLRRWAGQGAPVASRELGILLRTRADQQEQALALFDRAAAAGDAEAAFLLGEMQRARGSNKAAAAYRLAAGRKHAKAALKLALLYKNGEGVVRDEDAAAHWLTVASAGGDAHAMFLLSYAYRDGQGVAPDPQRARRLLEEAAEHDYPPALQELALTVQAGDALTPRDPQRAGELLKEATEHRHNNWRRY